MRPRRPERAQTSRPSRDRDPDLVDHESTLHGQALERVFERLPDGARALVVGHSPTNEAAILGLTGSLVAPLGKGDGVRVIENEGRYTVGEIVGPA